MKAGNIKINSLGFTVPGRKTFNSSTLVKMTSTQISMRRGESQAQEIRVRGGRTADSEIEIQWGGSNTS